MAVITVTISFAAFLARLLLEVHDIAMEGQVQVSLPSSQLFGVLCIFIQSFFDLLSNYPKP